MRKNKIRALLIVFTCLLGGCGQKMDADVSTVIVEKNGHITGIVIEDFSKPYYDEAQMKQTIDEEIADYNKAAGANNIIVENLSVQNNIAKLVLRYNSAEDYAAFNEETLFVGTIEEALTKGYDMKIALVEADNTENAISGAELLEMEDRKIIISEEPVRIRAYEKIKYCSPDATLIDGKEMDAYNVTGLSYLVL